jgi:hypothetical protein
MKQLSFVLIIVIGLMTLTPAPALYPHAGHDTVSIQAFNVCHGPSTGIHMDMPDFILERSGNQRPLLIVGIRYITDTLFNPLLIPFQDERPPRA